MSYCNETNDRIRGRIQSPIKEQVSYRICWLALTIVVRCGCVASLPISLLCSSLPYLQLYPFYRHPVPQLPNSATLCQPGRFGPLTATTTLHHLDPIRLPLPTPPLKHGQRVRLRVEDPLVEWQEVLVGEEEV